MNLRDLRYVVAVADLLHFGRAAQECGVSQSTLSAQVAKLEDQIGVRLFVREGRTVRLSARGRGVIEAARKALAAAEGVSAAARASRNPLEGPLRLGVIATVCPYLAPYLLPAAARALPRAPLVLVEDLTAALLPALLDGALDAAIVATDPAHERIEEIALYEEPFWLLAGSEGAPAGPVAADQVDAARLLLLSDGHCLRDQALDLCGQARVPGGLGDVRAASLETLMHLVAAGYGVTLAPQLAVEAWRGRPGVAAAPMEAGVGRRVRLVFRRDTPRKRAMKALAEAVRAALPSSLAGGGGLAFPSAPRHRPRESGGTPPRHRAQGDTG
jgi:LysR family hydrogen peroxide-inducible transcriptional activator